MHWMSFFAGLIAGWVWLILAVWLGVIWCESTDPKGKPWSGGVLHDKFGDK